ncbi:unnamed protein product [Eruca vesicaria subsp. sativa]|uniref:Leucine-rich repeat-containing N-terminal plant-type domain-containing protein n=1 Tax=Eruca vesicaria subsp. sativa TaxID=29727 RepID=A0ABC8KTF1_ERUVS|nr:unnamed protein product [Eruca vesicaria subsp. sativa]
MDGKLFLGQYLILVMVLLGQLHGYESCIQKESKALLELKKYIISRSQEKFSNNILPSWTNDTKSDCCQWEGIDCSRISSRVITLSIGRLFPKESYPLNLSMLHPFEEIRNLSLSSDRYNSQFNGFFDNIEGYKSLGRLRNLEILDLSFNQFNNSILPFLDAATSLTTLSLQNNNIYGPAKVVCQMRKLRELNLRGNHFWGQLPSCLGSLNNLRVLDLSSNQFTGNLPSSFSNLESLEYLSLSDNNFKGLFTLRPLTNLTRLKVFKLSSSDMVQVKTESTWQPKFQLSVAVLRSCSLEKIPSFLMYQKNLGLVDLSNNRLSGHIPTWLLENNQELEVLQLQNNSFTLFQMPAMVHNLQVLDISTNGIESFPDDIGRALPNMVHLNGSSNGFQGYFHCL